VLLAEAALILSQEPVEMMEKHTVEDGPLGMAEAIDSWHSRSCPSRNAPGNLQGRSGG